MTPSFSANYRLGGAYAVGTAFMYSTQEPFSSLGAMNLDSVGFVWVTQVSLALSIPLLLTRPKARRDFVALITDRANLGPLAGIFAIGMSGLLLYDLGLSTAHPIIIAAVLNLSPFWAALVALLVSGVAIPASPLIFFGCLTGAFLGAMAVAWSQLGPAGATNGLSESLFQGGWIYALPIPALSALGGTLVAKWFSKYDESAAIAANFLAPSVLLIPITTIILARRSELNLDHAQAIGLMMFGTVVAASFGRVLYQVALTATRHDNGYVSMFFFLVPALTGLVSVAMSFWIPSLKFAVNPIFFLGIGLICVSLLAFALKTWKQAPAGEAVAAPIH